VENSNTNQVTRERDQTITRAHGPTYDTHVQYKTGQTCDTYKTKKLLGQNEM